MSHTYNNGDWNPEHITTGQMLVVIGIMLGLHGLGVLLSVLFLLDIKAHINETPTWIVVVVVVCTAFISVKFIHSAKLFFDLLDMAMKEDD